MSGRHFSIAAAALLAISLPWSPAAANPCASEEVSSGSVSSAASVEAAERARLEAAEWIRWGAARGAIDGLGYGDVPAPVGQPSLGAAGDNGLGERIRRLGDLVRGPATGRVTGGNVFQIGSGGRGRDRSQWGSEEHRRYLERRRAELERELAERRQRFLDSEEGRETRDKLDENRRRHEEERRRLEDERDVEASETSCCNPGYGDGIRRLYDGRIEELDREFEQEQERTVEEDMRENAPEDHEEYREAREEYRDVGEQQDEIRRARAAEAVR